MTSKTHENLLPVLKCHRFNKLLMYELCVFDDRRVSVEQKMQVKKREKNERERGERRMREEEREREREKEKHR